MSFNPDPKFDRVPEKKHGNFVQESFKVFITAPIGIAGYFVVLLSGDGNAIAHLGPFMGFWAITNLLSMIFTIARQFGATHYEHYKQDKNAKRIE